MKPNNSLKHERGLRGWSQARVAEEIGTTPLNVGRWERGTSLPYPHFREKLCLLFGKNADELGFVEREDEEAPGEGRSGEYEPGAPLARRPIYDPAIPLPASQDMRLIGRDTLLEQLKSDLCQAEGRPVMRALHGLPGVGKTALLTELSYDADVRAHFRDGVLWAGPGVKPDILELLSRWGSLLGVTTGPNERLETGEDWARAIRAAIGHRRMLIVIDDVWEDSVAPALQVGGPLCAHVLTSRFPYLAIQFAANGACAVRELSETDGVALLGRYAPTFVQQAPDTAQALVRSVGALPLALTLMGKYLSVQVYSGQPRRLAAAVEHLRDARIRLQLSEARALAERHPSLSRGTPLSLQSIMAVSEQLLPEEARSALCALALFPAKPNSFSEEAALAVSQVPVKALDLLFDSGLLESNGPGRYMLHQTIADYARSQPGDPQASQRMVSYYVSFLETHARDHALLNKEASNILGALETAFLTGQDAELIRGIRWLADYLLARGLFPLAEKHLLRAYAASQSLADCPNTVGLLRYLGKVAREWGRFEQAEGFLLEGLEVARKQNDYPQICDLLHTIGGLEDVRCNYGQAFACFQEGLNLAREHHLQEQVCRLLNGLAVLSGKGGRYTEARSYLLEGLALARQLGYHERTITLLNNLGTLALERDDYAQAEAHFLAAFEQASLLKYELYRSAIQVRLSNVALKRGAFEHSREYLTEALKTMRGIGATFIWLQDALISEGQLAAAEGDDEGAENLFQEGLELSQSSGTRDIMVELHIHLAQLEIRRCNYARAQRYLQDIQPLANELGLDQLSARMLLAWGQLHLRRGSPAAALLSFADALARTRPEQRELYALALFGEARAAFASRDLSTARQQGEASLDILTSIGNYLATEVADWLRLITM